VSKPLSENGAQTKTSERTQVRRPPMYKVFLVNDDYTTMEFVVYVLQTVFHKSPTEANRIMLHVHFKGRGACGTYPFEIAETKAKKVRSLASAEGYPLRADIEKA